MGAISQGIQTALSIKEYGRRKEFEDLERERLDMARQVALRGDDPDWLAGTMSGFWGDQNAYKAEVLDAPDEAGNTIYFQGYSTGEDGTEAPMAGNRFGFKDKSEMQGRFLAATGDKRLWFDAHMKNTDRNAKKGLLDFSKAYRTEGDGYAVQNALGQTVPVTEEQMGMVPKQQAKYLNNLMRTQGGDVGVLGRNPDGTWVVETIPNTRGVQTLTTKPQQTKLELKTTSQGLQPFNPQTGVLGGVIGQAPQTPRKGMTPEDLAWKQTNAWANTQYQPPTPEQISNVYGQFLQKANTLIGGDAVQVRSPAPSTSNEALIGRNVVLNEPRQDVQTSPYSQAMDQVLRDTLKNSPGAGVPTGGMSGAQGDSYRGLPDGVTVVGKRTLDDGRTVFKGSDGKWYLDTSIQKN